MGCHAHLGRAQVRARDEGLDLPSHGEIGADLRRAVLWRSWAALSRAPGPLIAYNTTDARQYQASRRTCCTEQHLAARKSRRAASSPAAIGVRLAPLVAACANFRPWARNNIPILAFCFHLDISLLGMNRVPARALMPNRAINDRRGEDRL